MFLTTNTPKLVSSKKITISEYEQLWLQTNSLSTTLTILQTGAHPDDETSTTLSYLAKEVGARVVYCCAVRGEGGQNSIGIEKETALGVLRTREMEQAASQIPMELFWCNTTLEGTIRDFGFSKSAEDTFLHWGKKKLLESFVRVIREVKPNVVCPTFLDVDGQHGHHRAVTQVTIEAYYLSADPFSFPEHFEQGLTPWQANQLLLPAWGGGGDYYDDETPPPKTHFSLPTDQFLQRWSKSCFQLGEESRQFHRTQQMGFEFDAEFGIKTPFHILDCHYQGNKPHQLGAGLPTTLNEWGKKFDNIPQLLLLSELIENIHQEPLESSRINEGCLSALIYLRSMPQIDNIYLKAHLVLLDDKLLRLITTTSSLKVHVTLESNILYVNEKSILKAELILEQYANIKGIVFNLYDHTRAIIETLPIENISSGERINVSIHFNVPETSSSLYQSHFVPEKGNNTLYGEIAYQLDDINIIQNIILPSVIIKPNISVSCLQPKRFFNLQHPNEFIHEVLLESYMVEDAPVRVTLQLPELWGMPKPYKDIVLVKNEKIKLSFQVTIPNDTPIERYSIIACAEFNRKKYKSKFEYIDYPHIEPTGYLIHATQLIQLIDSPISMSHIGCLLGSTDNYASQLCSLIGNISLITNLDLATLKKFDTILIGSMAFSSISSYPDLRKWVCDGGRLVTFYHRPNDNWSPPGKLEIGSPSMRWRITQTNTNVTYLSTTSPLLNYPNVLTDFVWQGWLKERGLYFIKNWGSEYTPILRLKDEDGTVHDGVLLHGIFDKGEHIHCSLSIGHQLENVIPSAAQLFVNLLTNNK